jgi:hypothetical protein
MAAAIVSASLGTPAKPVNAISTGSLNVPSTLLSLIINRSPVPMFAN